MFFLPAPLEWSVCGPLSDTGPFLSVHLAPGDVQSLTNPHRGRSYVQWTGRYTFEMKKKIKHSNSLFIKLPLVLIWTLCFVALGLNKLKCYILLYISIFCCFLYHADKTNFHHNGLLSCFHMKSKTTYLRILDRQYLYKKVCKNRCTRFYIWQLTYSRR